jgi:hypothetical protein
VADEERQRQDAVYVDRMRRFEEEKIIDVKAIAGNWVHTHMEFAARSLELLSRAHQLVLLVDEKPELAQSLRGVVAAVPQITDDDGSSGAGLGTSFSLSSPLRQEVLLTRSGSSFPSMATEPPARSGVSTSTATARTAKKKKPGTAPRDLRPGDL